MKNVCSIKGNELLENLVFSTSPDMSYSYNQIQNIKDNILEDYQNGIKFCQAKVFPCDLYWENQNGLAKNWANGDILNIGEIIKLLDENGNSILYYDDEGTQPYYFKIIDIKTIYEGQVLLELKLMECKFVDEI